MGRIPLLAICATSLCAAIALLVLRDRESSVPRRSVLASHSPATSPAHSQEIDLGLETGPAELEPAPPPPSPIPSPRNEETEPESSGDGSDGEELLEEVAEPDPRELAMEMQRRRLEAIAGWDEFYAAARESPVRLDVYHSLVIDRVARELGCDEAQTGVLRSLVTEEQDALTAAMIDRYGSEYNLRAAFVRGTNAEELRRIVSETRAEFEESWQDSFTDSQLEIIHRHFRSEFRFSSGSIWQLGVRVGGPFSPPPPPPPLPEESEPGTSPADP